MSTQKLLLHIAIILSVSIMPYTHASQRRNIHASKSDKNEALLGGLIASGILISGIAGAVGGVKYATYLQKTDDADIAIFQKMVCRTRMQKDGYYYISPTNAAESAILAKMYLKIRRGPLLVALYGIEVEGNKFKMTPDAVAFGLDRQLYAKKIALGFLGFVNGAFAGFLGSVCIMAILGVEVDEQKNIST